MWECQMPVQEALELSSGSYAQVAITALARFPFKKPCRSVASTSFCPPKAAVRKRQAAKKKPVKIDPLYLFFCGLKWHRDGETSAGWELVQAMRSNNLGARALAAELLSETEDGRLLVRDLRRTRGALNLIAQPNRDSTGNSKQDGETTMNTPYGLPIVENCTTCALRKKGWFCHLSNDLLRSFSESTHLATYPGGAILFVEGQIPRGALILCSGKVKLSTTSKEGKVLILKVAEAGDVVGLSAVLSGEAYEITAETLEPCLVNFVDRQGLLRLIERSGELGLRS